jgi:hypothetical protein
LSNSVADAEKGTCEGLEEMLKETLILLIAALFAHDIQLTAQTQKRAVRPATAPAKPQPSPVATPSDRPLRSLPDLSNLEWWKLLGFLGSDSKSTYDATKQLNPQIAGSTWEYSFQYAHEPATLGHKIEVKLTQADQHVVAYQLFAPLGFFGGGFGAYVHNDNIQLAGWSKTPFRVDAWSHPEPPELYAGELALLMTRETTPEKAYPKIQFYYPVSYDEFSTKPLPGAAENADVPFGDVIFITHKMDNGFTIGAFCAARPGNALIKWSSTFDPSTSTSPIRASRTAFDWKKFVIYDFVILKDGQIVGGSTRSSNHEATTAFNSLAAAWRRFSPEHWTDTPEQARLAAQQTALAEQRQAEQAQALRAANEKQRRDAVLKSFAQMTGPANAAEISTALIGKTVAPTVELGLKGTLSTSSTEYPVTTLIYPDGREAFRIESSISFLHNDAATHVSLKDGLKFKISKVVAGKDNLQITLQKDAADTYFITVRVMLGKNWITTMTNLEVIAAVNKAIALQV